MHLKMPHGTAIKRPPPLPSRHCALRLRRGETRRTGARGGASAAAGPHGTLFRAARLQFRHRHSGGDLGGLAKATAL